MKYHLIVLFLFAFSAARAGEASTLIPPAELQALDRAISRELSTNQLGSQTLGDLNRLKYRLHRMVTAAKEEKQTALEPLDGGDDSQRRQLERLEAEARTGSRSARRSLALHYLSINEPEKAFAMWQQMGKANDNDMSYLIMASYMELALGEYNAGKRDLESALRFMDSRTSLGLSAPVLCQTVAGYRLIVPRKAGDLLPGEDTFVYVEVEGAEFFRLPDGDSECRLMFGLKLKDESQRTLWAEPNYGEYAPVFSGPVRDLHASLSWRVPNDMAPGRYHLFVEVVEDATKRRGESVLSFNVGRRDTNPGTRPTGAYGPMMNSKIMEDAAKAFPGADAPPGQWRMDEDYLRKKQFDLLQQYQKDQKVE